MGELRLITSKHMRRDTISDVTTKHLRGNTALDNQSKMVFSSWSVSPHFVWSYAALRNDEEPYICIIDTDRLDETNPAYHVPMLEFLANGSREKDVYLKCKAEYLIYGVILNSLYSVVRFRDMKISGLASQFPIYQQPRSPYKSQGILTISSKRITEAEISTLSNIAILFGDSFRIPVLISLVCLKWRDWADHQDIPTNILAMIQPFIRIGKVGEKETWTWLSNVDWTSMPLPEDLRQYQDVTQLKHLTQRLHEHMSRVLQPVQKTVQCSH